jgi:hypothetical protein
MATAQQANYINGTPPSNGLRTLREKIELGKLALNVPHVFAMDSGQQGVETEGKWGTQYRYMWSEPANSISFVDPVIHEMIARSGAQAWRRFKFLRLETRSGARKGPVQYRIELVNEVEEEEPADAFDKHMKATEPPPARPAAPVTAPPAAAPAAASPRVEQATPAASPSVLPAHTTMLASALVAAVDAANTAESYAEAHGRRVTFSAEDLRAFGLSIYIGLQGRRA